MCWRGGCLIQSSTTPTPYAGRGRGKACFHPRNQDAFNFWIVLWQAHSTGKRFWMSCELEQGLVAGDASGNFSWEDVPGGAVGRSGETLREHERGDKSCIIGARSCTRFSCLHVRTVDLLLVSGVVAQQSQEGSPRIWSQHCNLVVQGICGPIDLSLAYGPQLGLFSSLDVARLARTLFGGLSSPLLARAFTEVPLGIYSFNMLQLR